MRKILRFGERLSIQNNDWCNVYWHEHQIRPFLGSNGFQDLRAGILQNYWRVQRPYAAYSHASLRILQDVWKIERTVW